MYWETSGAYCTRLESLCPVIIVTSHCVFVVWKCYLELDRSVCECVGRENCQAMVLVLPPSKEKEEKSLESRTSCQGQGQGWEVSSSSFGGCIGSTLSAQTMQQTSTSGVSGVSCIRAIEVEMEEESSGIGFGHVIIGPIPTRQFLCGRS